jgi:hypothetical protein
VWRSWRSGKCDYYLLREISKLITERVENKEIKFSVYGTELIGILEDE